ncbi:thiamine ABC transporter substrate-binding protein [Halolamina sp. CBA1230]|uniref:thiamine ABC transporter substrate-binding protein n=1 Tax=Halolamina sp. CBA1230 TaxID=1853690 RepID=UPI0009A15015|nr:thiamine ABC transporter substrate-binding protein [Halolamina sp. CBA1230]QKY20303.1 thiamine ABC transporter substrate-binding protein [Halolamina sp. CBA1230]
MKRRQYLAATGALGLAGCLSSPDAGGSGTLTVATYSSFVDAPSSSPGPWLKEEFERRYPDATLEWVTPENGINRYVQQANSGATVDADAYVGLKVPELVRVDRETDGDLFAAPDVSALSNWEHVTARQFDERNRVLPVFSGYCSFVYDGRDVDGFEGLEALTTDAYAGNVLLQNPQTDNTGLYVLLWTIKEFGEDGYLDYWRDLFDNGARVLDAWDSVYAAFGEGEVDVISSFSNDRVYAKRSGADLDGHRIAFPGGHGYTNLSGMAAFAGSADDRLTETFFDFMLSPAAQGKLAELNVSNPVTDNAEVPDVFDEYARTPPEPLLFSYDELRGNLEGWLTDWGRMAAEQ